MQRCAECRAVGLHAVCSGVQGWVSAQHVQGCVEHALACNGVHGAECTGCARLSGAYGSVQQRAMVCRACGAGWEQKGRARTRGASRGLQGAHGSVGSAGLGGSAAVCKSTQEQAGLCKSAGWGGACRVCESMHECAVPCKSAQCACSVREYAERVRARAQRWVQVCTRGGPGGPPGPPLSTERAPWGDLQRWGALGAAGRCLLREHSCCKEMAPWGRGGHLHAPPEHRQEQQLTPPRHPPAHIPAPTPPPASPQRHRGGGEAVARREPPPARLVWGVCGGGGPPPAPGGRRARPWGCSAVRGRAESRSRLSWRRQEFLRRISSAAAVQPTRPPPVPPRPPSSIWGTQPRCRQSEGCCARGCAVPPFAALGAPGGGGVGGARRGGSDPPTARRGVWGRSSRPGFGAVRGRYLRSAAGGCSKCLFHMGTPRRHFQV